MSLRQFAACVEAWNKAHGAKEQIDPPTDEEFEDIKAMHGDD